jgi:hypothetical protein
MTASMLNKDVIAVEIIKASSYIKKSKITKI